MFWGGRWRLPQFQQLQQTLSFPLVWCSKEHWFTYVLRKQKKTTPFCSKKIPFFFFPFIFVFSKKSKANKIRLNTSEITLRNFECLKSFFLFLKAKYKKKQVGKQLNCVYKRLLSTETNIWVVKKNTIARCKSFLCFLSFLRIFFNAYFLFSLFSFLNKNISTKQKKFNLFNLVLICFFV